MSELSLIVFSPTGGTRKVADIVANELGDEVNVVDLADAGFDAAKCAIGELSVVAMPSFGGRAPQVAVERFGELVAPAGAKCVLVCVYGNRAYEDALVEMQDAAANCGFRGGGGRGGCGGALHHASVRNGQARRIGSRCVDRVGASDLGEAGCGGGAVEDVPGDRPYRKAGSVPLVPRASRACNACGFCARSCPVGAIDEGDPRIVDDDACISCMRCVGVCPQGARKVSGVMVRLASLKMRKACSGRKECELLRVGVLRLRARKPGVSRPGCHRTWRHEPGPPPARPAGRARQDSAPVHRRGPVPARP